jgi:hypothetical protein
MNQPAFPTWNNKDDIVEGMTLQDYFAIQIMQAFIRNTATEQGRFNFGNALEFGVHHGVNIFGVDGNEDEEATWAEYLAREAYAVANAMLVLRGRV